jgi:hypothetical protein
MERELSHDDVVDLLGAYALDALEAGEREAVEGHVQGCAACQAEVAEHREVAGLLTPGWAKPPAGLWDRISASLEEAPPPLDLAPVIALKRGQRGTAVKPRRSIGVGIAAMVAAAAVAMIGFLGVRVADDRDRIDQLETATPIEQLRRSADAARDDPGARTVQLASTDGQRTAEAVVLRDGTGYLVKSNLPRLPDSQTYQLWAVVGTTTISVGVLGPELDIVPFKMNGDISALAITAEQAGGVVSSRQAPVVLGRVQTA